MASSKLKAKHGVYAQEVSTFEHIELSGSITDLTGTTGSHGLALIVSHSEVHWGNPHTASFAYTASYVNLTGSGITIKYNTSESYIELTGSNANNSPYEQGFLSSSIQPVTGSNVSSGSYASVLGGLENIIRDADNAAIVNGLRNLIANDATNGTLAGGNQNVLSGSGAGIYSSNFSVAAGFQSVIIGGSTHTTSNAAARSIILGGDQSEILGSRSAVIGGRVNQVTSDYSVVVGGESNTASSPRSAVVAGNGNLASGTGSIVLGGAISSATALHSSVLQGFNNHSHGIYSTVVNGEGNEIQSSYSTISAGKDHIVNGDYSAILAGTSHSIDGTHSAIVGGSDSLIPTGLSAVTILGNNITASRSDTTYLNSLVMVNSGSVVSEEVGSLTTTTPAEAFYTLDRINYRTFEVIYNTTDGVNLKGGKIVGIMSSNSSSFTDIRPQVIGNPNSTVKVKDNGSAISLSIEGDTGYEIRYRVTQI